MNIIDKLLYGLEMPKGWRKIKDYPVGTYSFISGDMQHKVSFYQNAWTTGYEPTEHGDFNIVKYFWSHRLKKFIEDETIPGSSSYTSTKRQTYELMKELYGGAD